MTVLIGYIQADQIEPESLTDNELAENSVGFDEIQGLAVDTVHIRENAVTQYEIDDLAIQRRHMNDNVIIARMINAGAVETAKIQNLAVTGAKIADGTIGGSKYQDSSITSAKISSGAFGSIVNNGINAITPVTKTVLSGSQPASGNVAIGISTGTGSNQVALGNHTHSASGVPSHTHPASISIGGSANTGGGHTGHAGHGHSLTLNASVTTQAPSSLKLKKEISDYQPADIKNILNLKLKKYKYKNQLRHLQENINREWMHGYIAEEVQELGFEELLGYDEKGEPASLNYGLLSTLILELVKVQQTEIDSLKEEIQRLKEKI